MKKINILKKKYKKIKNIIYQEDIDNEDLIRAKEFIKESLEKDTLLRW